MQLRVNLQMTVRRRDESIEYPTRVEDLDERQFKVAVPTEAGNIPVGSIVCLEFANEGGAFSFVSRVLGYEQTPVPVMVLQKPDKMERMQRRDYVRLEANITIDYSMLFTAAGDNGKRVRTQAKDISGGGLLFRAPGRLPLGTRLDVVLILDGTSIHTVGEVVRELPDMDTQEGNWLGLRFVDIDERDREAIIRYIFNQQRERRRRGLV